MSRRACIGARRLPRRSSDVKEPYDVLDREIFAVVAISTCSVFLRATAQDTIVIGTVGGRNTLEWPLYIAYKNGTPAAETHSGQTQGFAWDQPGHLRSASSWNHYHNPSRANELAASHRRPAGEAADEVRACHQLQDGEDTRHRNSG